MADSGGGTDSPDRPGWRGVLQIVLIVGIIAIAIYFARAPSRDYLEISSEDAEQRIAPTAAVVLPLPTQAARRLQLTGIVTTLGTVEVRPEVSGMVLKVSENFRSGGEFAADETLVQIDPREFELSLARAKHGLEAVVGELKQKLDGEARSADLKRKYPDQEQHPWLARDGEVEQAQALVDNAKVRIALAEIALDKTRIRMPFDGYVTSTRVSEGQVLRSIDSDLGDVFPKYELRVRAKISNLDLDALAPAIGRKATVMANGRQYNAEVERISREVDVDTKLANLYLHIVDQEITPILPRPGTFTDVTVEDATHENVFVLPESAVQVNGSVWLVDNESLVSFTPISIGYAEDGWLVHAFDAKDGVVVGRIPGAREGLKVRPVER
ncbi:MAG: efflux RND transporter periplasmic adaptor subunit [Gammaproteobacteria bacterium]|nr:efflux RND transporter periplasmic adaptor subunit [Gammaproteobacteria bacterium]